MLNKLNSNFTFVVTFVKIDKDLNTCTSGGVEILGLHATVAPRRVQQSAPMLEEYCFVPNLSDVPYESTLANYTSMCSNFSVQKLQAMCNNGSKNSKIDSVKSFLHDLQCDKLDQKSSSEIELVSGELYLKLRGIFGELDDSGIGNMHSESVDENVPSLTSCPELLKPCLDIAIENILSHSFNIVEVGASGSRMHEHILPLVNSQPMINVTYTTCDKPGTEADESLNQFNFTEWDIALDPPSNIKNVDIMVAKNVLHKQRNVSKTLTNLSSALKENGFILIEEITSNFPVAYSSEQLWEEPLEIDDDRSCYCFCNEQKWCQIFDENGFEIIFKRSSQHLSTLFLIRPKRKLTGTTPLMIQIDDLTGSWFDTLKQEVMNVKENLWLTVNSEPQNGILGLFNCLKQEPNGERLR